MTHSAEIDARMAAIPDEALRVAEDVWTEDEPTLAEYELTAAILRAARVIPPGSTDRDGRRTS